MKRESGSISSGEIRQDRHCYSAAVGVILNARRDWADTSRCIRRRSSSVRESAASTHMSVMLISSSCVTGRTKSRIARTARRALPRRYQSTIRRRTAATPSPSSASTSTSPIS